MSTVVTPDDVSEATRLIQVALATAATDPRTGRIDIDLLTTGQSSSDRVRRTDAVRALGSLLARLWKMSPTGANYREVQKAFSDESSEKISEEFFRNVLKGLETDGGCKLS